MPGVLNASLDVSFVAAPSGAQLRSRVGYPNIESADPVEDVAAWILRLGGAVKQTILDWIHWPLPDGLNSEPHDFLSGESESARRNKTYQRVVPGYEAGSVPSQKRTALLKPVPPFKSGTSLWHPTARNALYYELNNPHHPYRPDDWPRGVEWPSRARVDEHGKWWPPYGWANGSGAWPDSDCALGEWSYRCGWRNPEWWGEDGPKIWYGPYKQLKEVGNDPWKLLEKEAEEKAEYLAKVQGYQSGFEGPPEAPRPSEVGGPNGPVQLQLASEPSGTMLDITEHQGSAASVSDEQAAADKILDLRKML